MRVVGAVAGLILGLLLLAVPSAQASCALPQPRADRLAAADAALVGTVLARDEDSIRLLLERGIKGPISGDEVELANPPTSIALSAQPGERVGLLLSRDGQGFVPSDCGRIGPEDLVAAALAAPCQAGDRPATRLKPHPRVLGCAQVPGGRGVQLLDLRARRRPGQRRTGGCLLLVELRRGPIGACGAPDRSFGADTITDRYVTGSVDPLAGGVVLVARGRDGTEVRRAAALVAVDGPRTLRRLDEPEAFGVFVVSVPPGTRPVSLEEHGARGEVRRTVRVTPARVAQ